MRHRENCDRASRSHSCDRGRKSACDPEVAVRSGSDRCRRVDPGKLCDLAGRGDLCKLADGLLREPDVAVTSQSHVAGVGIRRWSPELGENPGREIVAPDGVIGLIAKPNIVIRTSGDADTDAKE